MGTSFQHEQVDGTKEMTVCPSPIRTPAAEYVSMIIELGIACEFQWLRPEA